MNKDNIIYGVHAVEASLQRSSSAIQTLYLDQARHDKRLQTILTLANQLHINVKFVTKIELDKLTQHQVHQGVAAKCVEHKDYAETDLDSLLDALTEPALLLILDGVQDPHNLGACLRTANAAGVHAVIAPKDKAASITPVVRKVASGAAEHTPFIQVTNLARTLRDLKERGIWLYGMSDNADTTIYRTNLTGPVGIILGAEGEGMRRLTREHCDFLLKIPMLGTVSSLNVSVAGGVCLFEIVRQRLAR